MKLYLIRDKQGNIITLTHLPPIEISMDEFKKH